MPHATIVCGYEVGAYAFVGAGAVVTGDVPAYALMVGVPARHVGWMCQCGVRLTLDVNDGEQAAVCEGCATPYQRRARVLSAGERTA